jgi:pimeloyl-ACP methyl ester carboxylesterase/tetratricopeptide (TPR) repeat protein
MSQLVEIAAPGGTLRWSVVLIHGLGGDARATWRHGEDEARFWPQWLAEDVDGIAVYCVTYDASVSRYGGSAMHLVDRASNILELLVTDPRLSQGELILVGHSLGGLIIKHLLRVADGERLSRPEMASFLSRVSKVAFLGTPHSGSNLATWADRLRIFVRPSLATTCLVRNDANLRDLNLWYRRWATDRRLPHLVLVEMRPFRLIGLIVEPDSGDPGLPDARPLPIDADHQSISKPDSRTHEIYIHVRQFVSREPPATGMVTQRLETQGFGPEFAPLGPPTVGRAPVGISIASTHQRGGITAHTVNAQTIVVHASPAGADEEHANQPADDVVVKAHTTECEAQLKRALVRRTIPGVNALRELSELATRLDHDGDLRHCSPAIKAKTWIWYARLLAGSDGGGVDALSWLSRARATDPNADTTIAEAWVAAAEDPDRGLQSLRDAQDRDARSSMFGILYRYRSRDQALAWLDALGPIAPDFFTGTGWRLVSVALAENSRWEDASRYLAAVGALGTSDCGDLEFVEGVVFSALIVPSPLRPHTLTGQIFEGKVDTFQGQEADDYRARAMSAFDRAARTMRQLGEMTRATIAERRQLWLRLTDPTTRQSAENVIVAKMADGATAVEYAELAYVFSIPFDSAPLVRHLRIRELSGGLAAHELSAKLAHIRHTLPPDEIIRFLETEQEALGTVLSPEGFAFLRVDSLIAAGRIDRARELLDEHKSSFGQDYDRALDQIGIRQGQDVTQSIEARFIANDSDIDLVNLCNGLSIGSDIDKLAKYTRELFARHRSIQNAQRVVQALARLEDSQGIGDFLDNCDDLVGLDHDLAAAKGWALFQLGRIGQAQDLVATLLVARDSQADSYLQMNLLLAAGEWERFSVFIHREFDRRAQRDSDFLVRLAHVAAEVDRDKAMLLIREAVAKSFDDPNLLASCGMLAYQLGQDEAAMPWVARAASLSAPTNGPVVTKSMPEVHEVLIATADRTRGIDEAVSAGQIPMHVAASLWNSSLARILISQPIFNERERDPRRRSVVPIRHGGPPQVDTSQIQSISVDFTSLLLACELGVLDLLRARFREIRLPWSTMDLLLAEIQSCRFHQPSRVDGAKRLRALLADRVLQPIDLRVSAPSELIKEIGQDLAELLAAARSAGGRVVRPPPIYRMGSFMEAEAALGDWTPLVMAPQQLVASLEEEAVIDESTAADARRFLNSMDPRAVVGPADSGDGPLFLDELAISYLASAGLLESLRRSKRSFMVHPDLVTQVDQLIGTEADTARALEVLEKLRVWLRDTLKAGNAALMPRVPVEDTDGGVRVRVLHELVADTGGSDAVFIDDRMAGSQVRVIDRTGRSAPIIDIFDVLNAFVRVGSMTPEANWHARYILRRRGFVSVPIDSEELEHYLRTRGPNAGSDGIQENAELRAIRENLYRLRSTTILRQPWETPYLDRLRIVGLFAIRAVWQDVNVPVETAIARSNWIWRYLIPTPTDWAHTIVDKAGVLEPSTGFANQISQLLLLGGGDSARRIAFLAWVDREILEPLEVGSQGVLSDVVSLQRSRIREWVDEWTAEV